MAAVTRPLGRPAPLLSAADARREAEEMLMQFDILYPNAAVLRLYGSVHVVNPFV